MAFLSRLAARFYRIFFEGFISFCRLIANEEVILFDNAVAPHSPIQWLLHPKCSLVPKGRIRSLRGMQRPPCQLFCRKQGTRCA